MVFDCAAKYDGKSLNDILLAGLDQTNSLVDVLMRFRMEEIAFIADIEGMFNQAEGMLNQVRRTSLTVTTYDLSGLRTNMYMVQSVTIG